MGKNKFKKKGGPTLDERRQRHREAAKEIARAEKEKHGSKTKGKFTIDQLLDKAQGCIDRFEYEMAQKFCQRALEMEPDNVRALETSGALLIDLGNTEAAKQCFGRAVTVCPDKGYSKYMNLGQLFEGATAVECYQKGIELMMVEKEERETQEVAAACGGADDKRDVTDRDISNAFLSIAELYMTDCCFDDDAEEKCHSNITKAIAKDKDNPDALQQMASFLITKENKEEAKDVIKQSVSLWLPQFKASESPGTSTSMAIECTQSCESRLVAGKILIEVDECELAIEVLETLLEEDDEVVDVWYLIGWANHLLGDHLHGDDYKDTARSYLNKAKKVYKKTKCDDEEMLKHVDELLDTLGTGDDIMDSDLEADDIDDADDNIIQESDEEEQEDMDH